MSATPKPGDTGWTWNGFDIVEFLCEPDSDNIVAFRYRGTDRVRLNLAYVPTLTPPTPPRPKLREQWGYVIDGWITTYWGSDSPARRRWLGNGPVFRVVANAEGHAVVVFEDGTPVEMEGT